MDVGIWLGSTKQKIKGCDLVAKECPKFQAFMGIKANKLWLLRLDLFFLFCFTQLIINSEG